jgi:DNA end-binding protein Ku
MARAIWSGSITFGLISLPVKAYSAAVRQRVDFDMLHKDDGGKIEYKRVCAVDGKEVPWDDIVKGYEIEPGKYVTFTKEELAAIQPESTHTIDIEDFVKVEEIDPMYFDAPYHLLPDTGARRAYELLHAVMVDAGVVAVARIVMRTRERLVCIRPLAEGTLAMETMHFADEVRPVPEQKLDGRKRSAPTDREIEMARTLVDELTIAFDPEKYPDTWHDEIVARIEAKAEGQVVEQPADSEDLTATPKDDIMSALEASLEAARKRRTGAAKAASKRGTGSAGTSRRTAGGSGTNSSTKKTKSVAAAKPTIAASKKPSSAKKTAKH